MERCTFTRMERFIGLAILDYAASTWHFGGAAFGALSLYRARAGMGAARARAAATGCSRWAWAGSWWFLADALCRRGGPTRISGSIAGCPRSSSRFWNRCATAPRFFMCRDRGDAVERAAHTASFPAACPLHPGIGGDGRVSRCSRAVFSCSWRSGPSQHWILASGLMSRTPGQEPTPAGRMRRILHAVNSRGWALAAFVMLVSVILLPLFEVEANWQEAGPYYGDRIFGAFAAGLRTSSFVPALLAWVLPAALYTT